jgi:hypothetical protein
MKAPEGIELKRLFKPDFQKYPAKACDSGHEYNLQYIKQKMFLRIILFLLPDLKPHPSTFIGKEGNW